MMRSIFILCFLLVIAFVNQSDATCYKTGCHAHSAGSWCPQGKEILNFRNWNDMISISIKGMQTASWEYCWGVFGKQENCCTWT